MLAGLYDELRHQTPQLVADCEAEMPGTAA